MRKIFTTLFAALALALAATGCNLFTAENAAKISRTLATALEIAYEAGSKELAFARIAEMVADGKITDAQGKLLASAAQNGYEAFLARLTELAEPTE